MFYFNIYDEKSLPCSLESFSSLANKEKQRLVKFEGKRTFNNVLIHVDLHESFALFNLSS